MVPSPILAAQLRLEHLPADVVTLGIDERHPRFSWWVQDTRDGARQSAYRIRVASSAALLASDSPDLWDTGKRASDESVLIEYAGNPLRSRQLAHWDVQLWDADNLAGVVSAPATFELALLDSADWQASWIATPLQGTGTHGAQSPILRRTFTLPHKIASARLYITALGLYDAEINGQRIADARFQPGWTDYRKRIPYQTYDVTSLLHPGDNAIAAMLGDGWWCGRIAHHERAGTYGTKPWLRAQLEITLVDGSRQLVGTDGDWRWTRGPILYSDMIDGEHHDARAEVPGWSSAPTSTTDWSAVQVSENAPVPAHQAILVASPQQPVRVTQELLPIRDPVVCASLGRRGLIYDLGQNFTGIVRLRATAPAGATFLLRYAEVLAPDGKSIDVSNLRTARATDSYTFRGDPTGETWEARFAFHGFRYVELTIDPKWIDGRRGDGTKLTLPSREAITGLVLHNDMPVTGTFETGHALVNQLQQNITWGQRGNFLEAPTDCPQRDERLGWTGDAQVFAPTAAFNMDVAAFFTKWMRDLDDAQEPGGEIPHVAPNVLDHCDSGPGWSDARVVIPLAMYRAYADKRILQKHYPSMRKWIDYQIATSRDGVRCFPEFNSHRGFGDWLALDGDAINPIKNATPKDLIGTAYFAYSLNTLHEVAVILSHHEDAAMLAAHRARAVDAFNHHFVTPSGRLAADSQTSCLMALAFDLLPESHRPVALAQLVELLRQRDWHLSTGFLGTPLLCSTLTRFGRIDLAYKLLLQETYPGWLYPVTQGATTMWERWNSWSRDRGFVEVGMNSLNHYAYGAVGEWLYRTAAGIQIDPASPGYARVHFAPVPHAALGHCRATLRSPRGVIESAWSLTDDRADFEFVLPANTTGSVTLPDGTRREILAGRHRFESIQPTNIKPTMG